MAGLIKCLRGFGSASRHNPAARPAGSSPLVATGAGGRPPASRLYSSGLRMTIHRGGKYENQTVALDGNLFEECEFVGCRLVYSGTGTVGLNGCSLRSCSFHFEGAAANAVAFLNAIAGDPGLRNALPHIIPNLERRGRLN